MVRLAHLSLPVHDWQASRDRCRDQLGFEVEFEIAASRTAAMRDSADLTLFFYEGEVTPCPGIAFTLQVDDVEVLHRKLTARGIAFSHAPAKVFWGYLRLWDATTMKEKGGG